MIFVPRIDEIIDTNISSHIHESSSAIHVGKTRSERYGIEAIGFGIDEVSKYSFRNRVSGLEVRCRHTSRRIMIL